MIGRHRPHAPVHAVVPWKDAPRSRIAVDRVPRSGTLWWVLPSRMGPTGNPRFSEAGSRSSHVRGAIMASTE